MVRELEDGSGHFLHSKKGVTQGYPLYMIAYGIVILSLIQEIRDAHPCITKLWYDGDVGAGGNFGQILTHFGNLQVRVHCGDTSQSLPRVSCS